MNDLRIIYLLITTLQLLKLYIGTLATAQSCQVLTDHIVVFLVDLKGIVLLIL